MGAGLTPAVNVIAEAASFIAEQNQDFGIACYGYGKGRETSI
jgi:ribose 5-phosphate isomerase RpiB